MKSNSPGDQPTEVNVEIAASRCLQAAIAIEQLSELNQRITISDLDGPPSEVIGALIDLLEVCNAELDVSWPKPAWRFLVSVAGISTTIQNLSKNSSKQDIPWNDKISPLIQQANTERCNLLDPKPATKVVQLESLEVLDKQDVTDRQIAKIYGWYTLENTPDETRVQRARAGKESPPKTHTYTFASNCPTSQPGLRSLSVCIAKLRKLYPSIPA